MRACPFVWLLYGITCSSERPGEKEIASGAGFGLLFGPAFRPQNFKLIRH